MKNRVLIVEDDADINNLLNDVLVKNNYEAVSAYSGTEALLCLKDESEFDIVLLDLMLPGVCGEELIKKIRAIKKMPIVVISAKTSVDDRINVLKLGADDFVCKPFDINEVLARIEAQLRRYKEFSNSIDTDVITFKNMSVNKDSREVIVNGELINLTAREYNILELLISNPKKVFTRANIFESVWNSSFLGDDNTVNVHVSNLRSKISAKDKTNEYIQTVWGIGFKMKDD
ncbi:response regulator transcription factor [Inconstantimicrobium porci]|uniref:Stage 0 sporulation protein A homolog n=1 Tax=Inconstantimicrobium porci TaxID=2652291 RepID=A0A7X2T1W3_9CLOT|nr:response regulator transcription factor [Inconstantimicrobium porci]MDD6769867.1 response regulator transcription factor [Inconstantimicrobium porci]MSR91308.1 response regulator transcription factor [Inconstantimicrobium porci]